MSHSNSWTLLIRAVAPAEYTRSKNSRPLWLGSRWKIRFRITSGRSALSAELDEALRAEGVSAHLCLSSLP
jgi:hypothetical protein